MITVGREVESTEGGSSLQLALIRVGQEGKEQVFYEAKQLR